MNPRLVTEDLVMEQMYEDMTFLKCSCTDGPRAAHESNCCMRATRDEARRKIATEFADECEVTRSGEQSARSLLTLTTGGNEFVGAL